MSPNSTSFPFSSVLNSFSEVLQNYWFLTTDFPLLGFPFVRDDGFDVILEVFFVSFGSLLNFFTVFHIILLLFVISILSRIYLLI